jgi:predicted enzyme related to lactoylglutathione lyase
MEGFPAPDQGLIVTHFLTVRDVEVSREFYAKIFGGHVVLAEVLPR